MRDLILSVPDYCLSFYFVRVILFSEMLLKTISDDHKSLKILMPCDR